MEFFKSKPFLLWAGANIVFPIPVQVLIRAREFSLDTNLVISIVAAVLILAANGYGIFGLKANQKLFGITAILNLFVLVMVGDIAFFTAISDLPVLFKNLYLLVTQSGS